MIFPQPLKAGDTIAILSPASFVEPRYVDGAAEVLRQWGFNVVVYPHCKGVNGSYSGTVDERAADLINAFTDPSVSAILCSRGGFGTVQLLPLLDCDLLRQCAKWVIGFSDISALHAALHSAGVASVHASMAKHLAINGSNDPLNLLLLQILQGQLPSYSILPHELNRIGEASGCLVGGNIAVLSSLLSTPYNILKPDCILFIEDISEEVYRVERMLHTLRLNGTLPRLRGLIVGQFTNYRSPNANNETMEQMIARMVAPYSYPVAMNFPIGHIKDNYPLVEGAEMHLSVTADKVELYPI